MDADDSICHSVLARDLTLLSGRDTVPGFAEAALHFEKLINARTCSQADLSLLRTSTKVLALRHFPRVFMPQNSRHFLAQVFTDYGDFQVAGYSTFPVSLRIHIRLPS